jgi:hypothetical protein
MQRRTKLILTAAVVIGDEESLDEVEVTLDDGSQVDVSSTRASTSSPRTPSPTPTTTRAELAAVDGGLPATTAANSS